MVRLDPTRVATVLAALVVGFIVLHLSLQAFRLGGGSGVLAFTIAAKFDLDAERTVPTYFSALLLLGAAVLLWSITADQERRRDRRAWGGLALIFVLLSVEEITDFHNALSAPLKGQLGNGALHSAWVVPAMGLVLAFVLVYLRFFLRLPRRFQLLFAAAGVLYVGGAIGGEMLGGWHLVGHGTQNLGYVLISTLEEAMEMLGVVVFIYALLLHKGLHGRDVQLQFGARSSEPRSQREVVEAPERTPRVVGVVEPDAAQIQAEA